MAQAHTETRTETDGTVVVKFYNTDIFKKTLAGDVILNTGGFFTNTTKSRMNDALRAYGFSRCSVYQNRGIWYCMVPGGVTLIFNGDTLRIPRTLGDN